jgi:hypothetical protein
MKNRHLKPVACCKPRFCALPRHINPNRSAACIQASASTSAFNPGQDSDILDIVMEDATERDHDIPGVYFDRTLFCCNSTKGLLMNPGQLPARRTLRLIPRNFDNLLPDDEDINPSDPSGNDPAPVAEAQAPPQHRIQRVLLTLHNSLQMAFNVIGLCRQYPCCPSFEPDKFVSSTLLAKSCPTSGHAHDTQTPDSSHEVSETPFPFPNMTIYQLITWMNSGSHQKSEAEVMHLVKDVIHAEDFNLRDLDGFSVRRSLRALDNHREQGTVTFPDDWVVMDITIDIPTKSKDNPSKLFTIPGFHYRPLVAVIWSAFADIQASAFHLFPFKRLWKDPLDGHQERVFDELYTSDSWLEAQDDLQRQSREPGCSLKCIIAGLMFFSDATHLAAFGTAKAWPLYLYFGNLTKYTCSAPKSGACHLVGFLPSVCQLHLMLCLSCQIFSFWTMLRMYLAPYPGYQKVVWRRSICIVGETCFTHVGNIYWTQTFLKRTIMA